MKKTINSKIEYHRTGRNKVTISGNPQDVKAILWHDTWRRIILWVIAMATPALIATVHQEKVVSLLRWIGKWRL